MTPRAVRRGERWRATGIALLDEKTTRRSVTRLRLGPAVNQALNLRLASEEAEENRSKIVIILRIPDKRRRLMLGNSIQRPVQE